MSERKREDVDKDLREEPKKATSCSYSLIIFTVQKTLIYKKIGVGEDKKRKKKKYSNQINYRINHRK